MIVKTLGPLNTLSILQSKQIDRKEILQYHELVLNMFTKYIGESIWQRKIRKRKTVLSG